MGCNIVPFSVVMCFYAALRIQGPFRPWASASQGGGMSSDSESAGGSSESRSMDSPTASPGRRNLKVFLPKHGRFFV